MAEAAPVFCQLHILRRYIQYIYSMLAVLAIYFKLDKLLCCVAAVIMLLPLCGMSWLSTTFQHEISSSSSSSSLSLFFVRTVDPCKVKVGRINSGSCWHCCCCCCCCCCCPICFSPSCSGILFMAIFSRQLQLSFSPSLSW